MPKLADHEMTEFLGERGHLARIATVCADGSPSVVPVWFIFEGGKVLITPRMIGIGFDMVAQDSLPYAFSSRLLKKSRFLVTC